MPLSYCCSVNCSYTGGDFSLLKKQTPSRSVAFTKQRGYEKYIAIHFSDVFGFRKA